MPRVARAKIYALPCSLYEGAQTARPAPAVRQTARSIICHQGHPKPFQLHECLQITVGWDSRHDWTFDVLKIKPEPQPFYTTDRGITTTMLARPWMPFMDDPSDMADFDDRRSCKQAARWKLSQNFVKPQHRSKVSLKYDYARGAGWGQEISNSSVWKMLASAWPLRRGSTSPLPVPNLRSTDKSFYRVTQVWKTGGQGGWENLKYGTAGLNTHARNIQDANSRLGQNDGTKRTYFSCVARGRWADGDHLPSKEDKQYQYLLSSFIMGRRGLDGPGVSREFAVDRNFLKYLELVYEAKKPGCSPFVLAEHLLIKQRDFALK